MGAVSETWRDGRGARDVHGTQHWRALPVLPVVARNGTHTHSGRSSSREWRRVAAVAASVVDRDSAVRDCGRKLDRTGANRERVWLGGACRLHDCDPHSDLCSAAELGLKQRGGDARWTESGRETTGTRGAIRVADWLVQHAVSGGGRSVFCDCRGPGDPLVHERPGGGAASGVVLADSELRKRWVRLWNGDAASVQWGRRHGDADGREPLRFLAARDSAGLPAGDSCKVRADGSLLFDRGCRGRDRGCGSFDIPARTMEGAEDLSRSRSVFLLLPFCRLAKRDQSPRRSGRQALSLQKKFLKELDDSVELIILVGLFLKAVTFVLGHDVPDGCSLLFKGGENLVAFADRDARVVLAGNH